MRRTLHHLLLLCALALPLAAQDIETPHARVVQLDSSPRGAEVYAGDSLLGHTPCALPLSLARGARVYWPGRYAWSAQSHTLPDTLLTAEHGVFLLHFSALRTLRSVPSRAAVFRGDSLLGYTPLDVRLDDDGPLSLEKPGYERIVIDVMDAAGASPVHLQPAGAAPVQNEVRVADRAFEPPPARIWIPAVGSLAAGVASVYFKQHANELYAEYLRKGDESLLSDTEKYDIYAGVSLAVLQIGLAYFVYLLFTER